MKKEIEHIKELIKERIEYCKETASQIENDDQFKMYLCGKLSAYDFVLDILGIWEDRL